MASTSERSGFWSGKAAGKVAADDGEGLKVKLLELVELVEFMVLF
jgi:hypothetical protein